MVMTGDSGHGFKIFPIVGRWVRDLLNVSGKQQPIKRWRWREPKPVNGETSQDADVSWRVGDVRDVSELRQARRRCARYEPATRMYSKDNCFGNFLEAHLAQNGLLVVVVVQEGVAVGVVVRK